MLAVWILPSMHQRISFACWTRFRQSGNMGKIAVTGYAGMWQGRTRGSAVSAVILSQSMATISVHTVGSRCVCERGEVYAF